MTKSTQDQWAQWLLERRHGGDAKKQKAMLQSLYLVRDKVLHNARLAQGDTLLERGLWRWLDCLWRSSHSWRAWKSDF